MRAKLITFALSCILPVAASATTYNAVTSFTGNNPSGAFTYGQIDAGVFSAFSSPASTGYGGYTYYGSLPLVGYNTNNTAAGAPGSNNTFYVPQNELWMHPGSDPADNAAVRFTAPTTGVYTIAGEFTARDTASLGNGVQLFIDINDLLASNVYTLSGGYGSTVPVSGAAFLTAGETLDFVVNNNGSYYFDSTGFAATLTTTSATPEPSSLVLLGSGILGLAGAARRRLRS